MAYGNRRYNGNTRRSKYTKAQQYAYATGKAYRLGRDGKKIKFKNADTRASFSVGYSDGGKQADRYEDIDKKKPSGGKKAGKK